MDTNDFKTRVLFFSLLLVSVLVTSLLLFFLFPNILVRGLIAAVAIAIIGLGFRLALFVGVSDNRVRVVALTLSVALLFGILQVQHSLDWLYKPLLVAAFEYVEFKAPDALAKDDKSSFDVLSGVIIASWLAIMFLVMRRMGGYLAMGAPQSPLSDVLPNVTNLSRLQRLKRTLGDRLDSVDYATRWSDSNFVSLEAEVQILEGKNFKRKVVDLIRALRLNPNTRLFVVLGEPGTGKSVAMRKLTRDLLRESSVSDRIPVYINLKEWKTPVDWSPDNRPTTQHFHEFVYHNLLQTIDFASQTFLTPENYKALLEAGYFFFILDSFDEIPAVLDHNENSWIIGDLSECISRYVLSGNGSRGIVASRLFRQPKILVKERSVFEIQPFSDDRIIRAIDLACSDPDDLKKIILTERNDLGVIAKNPFLLHLIINHYNQKGSAPTSQAEMFHTFIDLNIRHARAAYGLEGYTEGDIYDICEKIAVAMFSKSRAGLEIGEPELRNEVDLPQLPYVLQFLSQARLGRIAPVSGAFSFSHRRFNEYFLVRTLSSKRKTIPFEAIQTDSRWRDALVLYAEIADNQDARELAQYAWGFAVRFEQDRPLDDVESFIQSRHALRFLIEGFRNRSSSIFPYQDSLGTIIKGKLSSDCDYIEKKTILEGVGLLPIDSASQIIVQSLHKYPGWISEEVATSARYLKRASPLLSAVLYRHCVRQPYFNGIFEAKRQIRILSISSAFTSVTSQLKWYLADVLMSFAGLLSICLIVGISKDPFWVSVIPAMLASLIIPTFFTIIFRGLTPDSPNKASETRNSSISRAVRALLSIRSTGFRTSQFRYLRANVLLKDFTNFPRLVAAFTVFFMLTMAMLTGIFPKPSTTKPSPRFQDGSITIHIAIFVIALAMLIPLRPQFLRYASSVRWKVPYKFLAYSAGSFAVMWLMVSALLLLPPHLRDMVIYVGALRRRG